MQVFEMRNKWSDYPFLLRADLEFCREDLAFCRHRKGFGCLSAFLTDGVTNWLFVVGFLGCCCKGKIMLVEQQFCN